MSIFPQPHHQLMLDGSRIVCGCSVQTEYEIFIRVGRHSATSMDDVCVQQTFVHLPIDLLIGVRKMIAPRLAVRTHHIEDNHILWAHVDHAESNSPAKFVDRQVRETPQSLFCSPRSLSCSYLGFDSLHRSQRLHMSLKLACRLCQIRPPRRHPVTK